jgi:hypothetical protein
LLLGLLFCGCGKTQFSPGNRHLLTALETAVSAKNSQWLDAVVKQVDEQHSQGTLSEAEFSAIQGVINDSKRGDWETALKAVFKLIEGQRPTSEDIARVRARKLTKQ